MSKAMSKPTNPSKTDELLHRLLTEDLLPPKQACRLEDLLTGRKVVVYGCGEGLNTFSAFVLCKYGIRPEALLDIKFSEPALVDGVTALSPEHFHPSPDLLDEAVAVITVGKRRFHAEIIAKLKRLGFRHILLATDIYEYHLAYAPPGFEQLGQAFYKEHADSIREAYALLDDSHSQEVFTQILHLHVARMPMPIRNRPFTEQYFPLDLHLSRGMDRVVNCGAFDGDTVRQLHAKHGKIESLICFEPDPGNFSLLQDYLGKQSGALANSVMAFPCGVWNDEAQLQFGGGMSINSAISEVGNVVIQCVALDHVIPDFRPTFVNMDIEGAEMEAIRGAANLIKRNQPDLGISVYHRPEHLWEIALALKQINPGYRFFLRNYSGFPVETVLYATT